MAKLINKTQGFTIVSNAILRDKTLGIKERGLLITLLSLPDNWEFSVLGLTKILPDGKDTISATLKKIEKAGYLQRIQSKNSTGQFSGYDWIITHTKKVDLPFPENPSSVKPETDIPLSENTPQLNTNKSSTKKSNTKKSNLILSTEERDKIRLGLKITTGIDHLIETDNNDIDKDIFEILVDVCTSTQEYYVINGQQIPTPALQARLRKIDYDNIRTIRENIESLTTPIKNIKAYIIKCLYDSATTINTYYTNKVAVDLHTV